MRSPHDLAIAAAQVRSDEARSRTAGGRIAHLTADPDGLDQYSPARGYQQKPEPTRSEEFAAYLIFSALNDMVEDLTGREHDPDYYLDPATVVLLRDNVQELLESVGRAKRVMVQ
ncbi:hypothetical protein [Nocardioides bruguierae]|uniref:Uncharacterized protein n=1 Tax=Nocardioides bruguierae TaxID=2945102 RepID=A0A9X2D6M5_9ACTN|nr:hypothetical protein [Nocardioides bruguierae]MCM0619817.1 hypothetical protein [Nocardioides bruguierae]